MKQILLMLLICTTGNIIFAQDIIIKRSGDEIESKVIEITNEAIKYKSFHNIDGPIRNILISDVFMIIYENGVREKFTEKANDPKPDKEADTYLQRSTKTSSTESYIKRTDAPVENETKPVNDYKGKYFMIGVGFGTSYGGLGVCANWRLGDKEEFGWHAGAGYIPDYGAMASVGAKYFPYKNFYLNAQLGIFGYHETYETISYSDHYYNYEKATLYGPSFLVGGDWTWGGKTEFGFNAALGLSYNMNEYTYCKDIYPALDMGFIVKF